MSTTLTAAAVRARWWHEVCSLYVEHFWLDNRRSPPHGTCMGMNQDLHEYRRHCDCRSTADGAGTSA
jgi:hypothetical protein